jgi:hypothetical protein
MKMLWIFKVIVLLIGTLAAGMIPALAIMWANYNFEPEVCWTNIYGGWLIVPMLMGCCIWGVLALEFLERRLGVCNHGR